VIQDSADLRYQVDYQQEVKPMSVPTPTIQNDPWPLRIDADGTIRVGDSRLTLAAVVEAVEDGLSPDEIAEAFEPPRSVIYAVLAYYLNHKDELKPYLEQQAYEAYKLRDKIEASQRPFPTRSELAERLAQKHAQTGQ
jgi:uncharacterized protein (DUF433 family)